jgi:hypothetical protein
MNIIINRSDFVYEGVLFYRSSGRCYLLVESRSPASRAARKSLLVSKRISLDYYYQCLESCRRKIGGAT